ncbi:MBL fold metallo-hydrolase [Paenibacillus ginsengarvi]|uniref:MBL fold metallo-hydrolase n=1 Tax=Paenibacillus ginsengarvi TaxID=400777 RepID=A0A3B0CMU4_9BACL|nr:MBL fold metallo-hydrolase [Paenibacillus ginsengarvi]RKN86713.1 MBL fold metallo-hydrolase [Paenibacillus ginsengarvi]
MSIKIRMIGTGSAFAKKYFNNNALVTSGDYTLLIDFGITGPLSMYQMNMPLDRIDGVVVTHLHADHIGGLEELMLRLRFDYKKKPTLFIEEHLVQPLWDYSLRGGLEFGAGGTQKLDDFFHIIPLTARKPQEVAPGLRLEIWPTRHFPDMPSYAIILNDKLFYSGDTVFDPNLIGSALERGCDYILHECQLEGQGLFHATLAELLTLPEDVQRKVRLMHYGDHMEQYIGHTGLMTFLHQHETYEFPI